MIIDFFLLVFPHQHINTSFIFYLLSGFIACILYSNNRVQKQTIRMTCHILLLLIHFIDHNSIKYKSIQFPIVLPKLFIIDFPVFHLTAIFVLTQTIFLNIHEIIVSIELMNNFSEIFEIDDIFIVNINNLSLF